MRRNNLLNWIGQIRIYSLVDLMLLCVALKADNEQFIGIIFLHIGFLLLLEHEHKHNYRIPFPQYLWILVTVVGVLFFHPVALLGFLVSSYLYTKKKIPAFGLYSPLLRGAQNYFLAAGVIGFLNPLSMIIGILFAVRNVFGDVRDVAKDRKEGMKTIPVILGLQSSWKYVHLIALFGTTIIWWYLSGISILWLLAIIIIQLGAYNLTPR